eukprot:m.458562 g.458562  ORF g.458562 m.458562 type:complete len:437 (-) comp21533_c0_seq1:254-1564(-)
MEQSGGGPQVRGKRQQQHVAAGSPPMVHVPGIKASSLVDKDTGEMGYGSTAAFFNLFSPDFSLPAKWDGPDGRQREDNLVSGGVIEDLELSMPFGGRVRLLQVQSPYTEYCRERADRLGSTFHIFNYDWRREISESTENLEVYLDTLVGGPGGQPVQLIAHSMGAVVSLPLIAKRPDLFHSVLFLAPGVHTDVGFLEDCSLAGLHSPPRTCNNTVFNSTMLSPSLWATCPAPYSFFPLKGFLASDGKPPLTLPDGTPVDFDFYNLDDYKRYRLGIYHPHSQVDVTPELEEFMRNMFRRCVRFRRNLLDLDLSDSPVPIRCLMSLCKDTPVGYVIDEEDVWWRKPRMVHGDGRVSAHAIGKPPAGLRYREVVASDLSHFQVQNDTKKIEILLNKLMVDGDEFGVADAQFCTPSKQNGSRRPSWVCGAKGMVGAADAS